MAQNQIITDYKNPDAQGTLLLQVRNDSVKYVCQGLKVEDGLTSICDRNPEINYSFFIQRNKIQSTWLNDISREYDYFIKIKDNAENGSWVNYEKKLNVTYKEDFTSDNQKTGITYKHHESRKSIIEYTLANPKSKDYADTSKFQFKFDWEETIKGRFESFHPDGIKKFRHNYEISRMMTLDKNVKGIKKSTLDIQVIGTIQEYHSTGKKKMVVTYKDRIISKKSQIALEDTLFKSTRKGERITYRENGKMNSKCAFNSIGANGRKEYYGPKGLIVVKIEEYENGILNGKYSEYYMNGNIKTKGEYKNGAKSGSWLNFSEDGKKIKS
jgi:antitoxin component YwqK of YwqJK toxin-antitoxin module